MTQARHAGRADVVGQHIGRSAQLEQGRAVVRLFQVQHDRALVAVGVDENVAHAGVLHRARVAHDVAARRLDLDDVSTIVTQNLRGIRPQHHPGHVDDAVAV
jgi:ABC-type uncharacterized transport system ATPase component